MEGGKVEDFNQWFWQEDPQLGLLRGGDLLTKVGGTWLVLEEDKGGEGDREGQTDKPQKYTAPAYNNLFQLSS